MIPDHIATLAIVFIVAWAVIRWGAAIFTLYALAHFFAGEWGEAALALLIATWLGVVKGCASWFHWNAHGREAWLQQRRRKAFW